MNDRPLPPDEYHIRPEDMVLPNRDLVHVSFGGPNRSIHERAYLSLPEPPPLPAPPVPPTALLPARRWWRRLLGL